MAGHRSWRVLLRRTGGLSCGLGCTPRPPCPGHAQVSIATPMETWVYRKSMAERRLTRRTMGRRQHRTSTRGSPSDGHVVVTAAWDFCVLDDGVDRDTRRLGHGHQQKTRSPCPEAKDVNTLPQCPDQAWLPCDCMGLWGALTAGILRVLSISPCAPRVPGMLMDPGPRRSQASTRPLP